MQNSESMGSGGTLAHDLLRPTALNGGGGEGGGFNQCHLVTGTIRASADIEYELCSHPVTLLSYCFTESLRCKIVSLCKDYCKIRYFAKKFVK